MPLTNFECALRYWIDAPAECWHAPEVLNRIDKWGMSHTAGGLIGYTYKNYHFRYRGYPIL